MSDYAANNIELAPLAFQEEYVFHKLVFINSGTAANVELPTNLTALLLGHNNEGKTSSLSAIKLFILPEMNFRDCEAKFAFISKEGYYDGLESFNYYFPSPQSFIICEAENTKGRFCHILHRSREELGYGRVVISKSYDELKSIFWDFESTENDGFGQPREDLDLSSTLAELKKLGGRQLASKQEIRDAIYVRPTPLGGLSSYCLVPLSDRGERGSADALRALMGLAFDIRATKGRSLPEAVATIIQGEVAGKDTSLDLDLGRITADYQELRERTDVLNAIRSVSPQWSKLMPLFGEFLSTRRSILNEYPRLSALLSMHRDLIIERKTSLAERLNSAMDRAKEHRDLFNVVQREAMESRAAYKQMEKREIVLTRDAERIEEVKAEAKLIGVHGQQDIIAWLKEEEANKLQLVAGLNNEAATVQLFSDLQRQHVAIKAEISSLEKTLSADSSKFLQSLSGIAANHLYSLNTGFSAVNVTPSQEQLHIVESFAQLLSSNPANHRLTFIGDELSGSTKQKFDLTAVRETAKERLKQRLDALETCQKDMREVKSVADNAKSPEYRSERIKEYEEELKSARTDIALISAEQKIMSDLEQIQNEILGANEAVAVCEEKENKAKSDKNIATAALETVQEEGRLLEFEKKAVDQISSDLDRGVSYSPDLAREKLGVSDEQMAAIDESTLPSVEAIGVEAETLLSAIQAYPQQRQTVIGLMHTLISAGVLPNVQSPEYAPPRSNDDLMDLYDELNAIFSNLEANESKLRQDISSHNTENGIRTSMLKTFAETIRMFGKGLNEDFARYSVSNLSSVNVDIVVDPMFTGLLSELDNESFHGNQLKSESFYKRLNDFCLEFFAGANRTMRISRVIKDIRFSFTKGGIATDASQSNGTNCVLNVALLSILLKRLVPQGISLRFPIVFDEVGSLDELNLPTIKKMVEDHGFVLFVANPYNNGVIASLIENWYDLSLNRVTGRVIGECSVIHFDMREGITDDTDSTVFDGELSFAG